MGWRTQIIACCIFGLHATWMFLMDIRATYTGNIPAAFNMTIFNGIEDHVKYLVWRNTWLKFVEAIRRRSVDSNESGYSAGSGTMVRSWGWISETRGRFGRW
ncbi:uncharacterized protein BO80DRAFT_443642 [Aspergillus ibericus CBS 121593]|uniref:Uncharacterized protein n=1 Tax=Aspergillus ibericus CBS 121593 TaxID=1448316 RepID=A0A395H3Y9_9EURO|nr:hypothetical protein BO80DRAFT_443642 [Aspergillus ibericus CBS 121593]RAL02333.1 hypothetical protein BO80DRAFT_443642 [Aspergillus ibericus CBS 121593]